MSHIGDPRYAQIIDVGHLAKDECECGDYRENHDASGCKLCAPQRHPWERPPYGPCKVFRLFRRHEATS